MSTPIKPILDQQLQEFLQSIPDENRRSDAIALLDIMRQETGATPFLYGTSIIGFGVFHYKYESGREGDTCNVGFAPRKPALVLYGLIFYEEGTEKLEKLGKYKAGKGCLYIKRLSDVDEQVLREMIRTAYKAKLNHDD